MTTKLYEQNPMLATFSATVQTCTEAKKGFEIILNQTAFYPEGGGQPYDIGTLGAAKVLEVHQRGGEVVHLCDSALELGAQVQGEIDWPRRFALMQQHSGEHIVSGFAHSAFGCENVGFHMGANAVTIDLSKELDENQLAWLEQVSNQYVWENHPVEVMYPSEEQLKTLEYRSKKQLTGQVRIISFPQADTCACCGTHVLFSGQIGLIKLLSAQKFREGVRIELLCGQPAFAYMSEMMEQNRQISAQLSAKPAQTGAAVGRLLEENLALKSQLTAWEDRHFAQLAEEYANCTQAILFQPSLSSASLRRLCDKILQQCAGLCACFSGDDESGYQYVIGEKDGDLRGFSKEFNATLHGRGGGKPDFVQGSVQARRAEIEAFLSTLAQ